MLILRGTICLVLALFAPLVANGQSRTAWTTSKIQGAPTPPPPYRAEIAFPALKFTNPTVLTNAPGSNRMFVVELRGKIFSFVNEPSVRQAELVLDLKQAVPEARQVYGLTFHPKFATNRLCYICYVLDAELDEGTRLSRFRMTATDPPVIEAASEEILLTWKSGGHNGGCLKFGPDGFLYVSAGDAGPAFPPDPLKAGQDVSNLLSTVMRIDVDRSEGARKYAVPKDNPFVELPNARTEVWAFGFRNPWKMSFDSATGDLWVGDVGWELWEMVYRVEKGGNYGWSLVEGRQAVHRERTRGPTPILKPTAEHAHTEARSITGGFVYRGDRLPELEGEYIYGDYVTGKMWALKYGDGQAQRIREIADTHMPIICFGTDNNNELFVVSYEGQIFRLEKNKTTTNSLRFPRRLSETGLFKSVADHQLAEGVEPYNVIAEMWQDGIRSKRFVAVPGSAPLSVWTANNAALGQFKGQWRFPEGSVIGKTITLPNEAQTRAETQILHYHNGIWEPYSYVWNDTQADAVLMEKAGRKIAYESNGNGGQVEKRTWRVAGRNECMLCHTARSGALQAVHVAQLDRPEGNDGRAQNQLQHLTDLGFFLKRPKRPKNELAYVSPHDTSASLDSRARTYLHVNCAHCHRRGGGGTASMDVVHRNKLERTNLLGERPTQGTFGMHGAQVVAAGDPYRSVLLYRVAKTGRGRMPYVGSHQIDAAGVALLRDWIRSLPSPADQLVDKTRQQRRVKNRKLLNDALGGEPAARREAIEQLLASTSGALRLAVEQHERQAVRSELAAAALKLENPATRDLFEHILPESARRKSLGDSIDPQLILAMKGSRERGRQLFEKAVGLQCRKCHQADEKSQSIGPSLAQLRKLKKADLLDSILRPSKRIEPQFVTYLVETKDGRVFSGLLADRNERRIVLLDATGKRINIAANDIEFTAPQQKSLMPELQLRDSTAQEVADLLEFLFAK